MGMRKWETGWTMMVGGDLFGCGWGGCGVPFLSRRGRFFYFRRWVLGMGSARAVCACGRLLLHGGALCLLLMTLCLVGWVSRVAIACLPAMVLSESHPVGGALDCCMAVGYGAEIGVWDICRR